MIVNETSDVERIVIRYRPKGSMCAGCSHHAFLCTGLKFAAMPIIGKDEDGTLVVRCTDYEKRDDSDEDV